MNSVLRLAMLTFSDYIARRHFLFLQQHACLISVAEMIISVSIYKASHM